MKKTLVVDTKKCTGCDSCILACSFKHGGEFSLAARIQVEKIKEEGVFVPIMCRHCAKAPCIEVCPTDALFKDEKSGLVLYLEENCIGCRRCLEACPFGAILFDEDIGLILKCDHCDGDPECVKVCIPSAIRYEEANSATYEKRQITAQREQEALNAEIKISSKA